MQSENLQAGWRLSKIIARQTGKCCVRNRNWFESRLLKPENENLLANFSYVFTRDAVKISCETIGHSGEQIKFIVPVIKNSARLVSSDGCTERDIFFLTGGFAADEYTFELTPGKTELTLYHK